MREGSKILVIDGDVHLGKFLKRQLSDKGYQVDVKPDGKVVANELSSTCADLLILDLNLPGKDGMDLIVEIRKARPHLPILVLTARNRIEDIVCGLDKGADDYLTKPFSFLELVARMRVLLGRNMVSMTSSSTVGDLEINREEHWALRGKRRVDLTPREFDILEYLMNNAGKTISRKTLMENVWKVPFDPTTNIVDVYVKYLRDKVDIEGETKLIRTVRGVGYVLGDGYNDFPHGIEKVATTSPSRGMPMMESTRAA
jgi:two-component system copper resistance phosphate regulon response regulator CusR